MLLCVLTVSCGTCLDVVFWLSVTELSLAQITGRRRIPLEVAQDTVGKSRSVLDRARDGLRSRGVWRS